MNLVDSSAWLEYLADGPGAGVFEPVITKTQDLLVPVIYLYEVFKRVLQQRDEHTALRAVALMQQGRVVELDADIALRAVKHSIEYKLPMADAIILATAHACEAIIWTQDADFQNINGVKYYSKDSSGSV
ncbi:MAG: twitching motility protein PilT [Gammaproteobacteria bacterium RBG_16_51_14]|nr:MAG: twitching motility protein PilT [Gammaproteobacteria bacterium RBG_16_51_14]